MKVRAKTIEQVNVLNSFSVHHLCSVFVTNTIMLHVMSFPIENNKHHLITINEHLYLLIEARLFSMYISVDTE